MKFKEIKLVTEELYKDIKEKVKSRHLEKVLKKLKIKNDYIYRHV